MVGSLISGVSWWDHWYQECHGGIIDVYVDTIEDRTNLEVVVDVIEEIETDATDALFSHHCLVQDPEKVDVERDERQRLSGDRVID